MKLKQIIDLTKAQLDRNGIWIVPNIDNQSRTNNTWNRIYDFDVVKLNKLHNDFERDKLADLLTYVDKDLLTTNNAVYLEIGCGPSFLGKYLLENSQVNFVGVDFNYNALIVLKEYLEQKKIDTTRCLLICSDIRTLPIKNDSIDFIYGGGVIEHVKDTHNVLKELYRVLKNEGVSLNTVPAFNLFWGFRFWMSIPNVLILRQIFEFIHITILKEYVLSKFYGYELSFTKNQLKDLHKEIGFKNIVIGVFAFHPNRDKIHNNFLYNLFFLVSRNRFTCPFYFVKGAKFISL